MCSGDPLITSRHWFVLLLAFAAGCARGGLGALPHGETSTWGIGVVTLSADRHASSIYTLQTEALSNDEWLFTTLRSEGDWEEAGIALHFDSNDFQPSDPWPIVMQHAISAVPTRVRVDDGLPMALVEPDRWRVAVVEALEATQLGPVALASGRGLIDPGGVIRDLQRSFPGTPPEGQWVRSAKVLGLDATLVEACERSVEAGLRRWRCVGEAEGPTDGSVRLYEVSSETVITADRRGLLTHEHTLSGTMVLYDPAQDVVLDRPIAAKRMAQRQ